MAWEASESELPRACVKNIDPSTAADLGNQNAWGMCPGNLIFLPESQITLICPSAWKPQQTCMLRTVWVITKFCGRYSQGQGGLWEALLGRWRWNYGLRGEEEIADEEERKDTRLEGKTQTPVSSPQFPRQQTEEVWKRRETSQYKEFRLYKAYFVSR